MNDYIRNVFLDLFKAKTDEELTFSFICPFPMDLNQFCR